MGLYYELQTTATFANFIPFITNTYISVERSYKTPFKKDLLRTMLLKYNQGLKFCIILSILHVLIFLIIYQTIHSF